MELNITLKMHWVIWCFYHFKTFLQMKLTRLSIGGQSIVVVKSVGNVTTLLCFKKHDTTLYRVDCAWRNIEKVSRMNLLTSQELVPALFLDHLPQLISCPCIMTDDYLRILVALQNVPALCLTERILMFHCISVIRVNLNT